MSGDGSPTSQSKSTSGDKCDCPLQTHATCHVKKLKVTTVYKDRAEYTEKTQEQMMLLKPGQKPPDEVKVHTLEASLKNNRIVKAIEEAGKRKQFQDQVVNGAAAAKQSVKDAGSQTVAAGQQAVQQRSLKGVEGPTGPTAQQKQQMSDGVTGVKEISHAALVRAWDREVYALLQRYDIVIETLASFYGDSNASYAAGAARTVNTVDIKIEVDAEGTCPCQMHDFVEIKALTNTNNQEVLTVPAPVGADGPNFNLRNATWKKKTRSITMQDVMAASIIDDVKTAANPLSGIIKLLRMGFAIVTPMELEFRLQTCGKKDRNTLDPPDLAALVRIYRETTFAVGIKVPPFKKFERKSGSFKTETVTTSDWGMTKHETTKGLEVSLTELKELIGELPEKGKNALEAIKTAAKNRGNGPIATAGKRTAALAQLAAMSAKSGSLLPFALGMAVTAQRIERAWKAMDFISGLIGIMQKFPQCGFKLTVEWSFLDGLFEFSLGTAPGKTYTTSSAILAAANDRYVTIGWKAKLGVVATIMSAKIEASFGLLIEFPVVGRIEARVVGAITGLVEYKAEAEWVKGELPKASTGPSGKIVGRLYAVAALETCVYTWKEEIGIEAGVQIDTAIEWSTEGTKVKAKLKRLPVQWYFHAMNARTKVPDAKLYTIYEAATLWEVDEKIDEKKS
jgi:hypothetical protein